MQTRRRKRQNTRFSLLVYGKSKNVHTVMDFFSVGSSSVVNKKFNNQANFIHCSFRWLVKRRKSFRFAEFQLKASCSSEAISKLTCQRQKIAATIRIIVQNVIGIQKSKRLAQVECTKMFSKHFKWKWSFFKAFMLLLIVNLCILKTVTQSDKLARLIL